ncbi:unnamed protein product [Hermetia illucens]|uniref:Ig-like domain-containing protein n=1 Tax=Hermetia illucens TaxID=343691 RepID=A0A7R8UWG7_HERIL|nr:unnamed protein product [Hermetia illucens]
MAVDERFDLQVGSSGLCRGGHCSKFLCVFLDYSLPETFLIIFLDYSYLAVPSKTGRRKTPRANRAGVYSPLSRTVATEVTTNPSLKCFPLLALPHLDYSENIVSTISSRTSITSSAAMGFSIIKWITLLIAFVCLASAANPDADQKGPIFLKEPTNRIDFSNSTGAEVECRASGNPPPEIIWIRSDGTAVGDVPGLRQVSSNGNLVFPPFRAEDYRQEVHAQVYACLARNQFGTIISRDVNVRAVVNQFYKAEILTEYVIRGNSAVLKCSIPSFVADFVKVESWIDEEGVVLTTSEEYVVSQFYITEAENEYVIKGNSAVMKCKIPSFVADFVQVEAWVDEDGKELRRDETDKSFVVIQPYESEADNEYVIRGNSVVMKCEIPSYVADFVQVDLWMDSDENMFYPNSEQNYVVHQFYQTRVIDEFVLRGNAATLKCLVPSFVADFIIVESWVADDGTEITLNGGELVVNQYYESQVYDEFVIKGNSAVFKCQIPSFVADHVEIIEWVDTNGGSYIKNATDGKYLVLPSGELHIREVGPEDGYKSYQCRTKHRLTGETRLSATKGRLVITEPVGRVSPKFPTMLTSSSFQAVANESVTLLCLAQAFPVAIYRSELFVYIRKKELF